MQERIDEKNADLVAKFRALHSESKEQSREEMKEMYGGFDLIAPKGKVIVSKINVVMYNEDASGLKVMKAEETIEHKGYVVAVGEGVDWVRVGDIVHIGFHSGTIFGYNGEGYKVLGDYEILAIDREK